MVVAVSHRHKDVVCIALQVLNYRARGNDLAEPGTTENDTEENTI